MDISENKKILFFFALIFLVLTPASAQSCEMMGADGNCIRCANGRSPING